MRIHFGVDYYPKHQPRTLVLCTCNIEKSRGARTIQKVRFLKYAYIIETMDENIYIRLNAEEHLTKIPGTHMMLTEK